jgi:GntR family transcriptional regulator, transcriptional repressor for pyruvate dehydrogenase complex
MPESTTSRPVPPFEALKPIHRSQAVRDQLLKAIERGELKPGDSIPSERQLGETFGVSRVSVREAIRSLEALGLVEVHHGRGSFVARGPGDRYVDPFVSWLRVHQAEVDELLKVRGALDELAAAEAAANHDPADLVRLRAAQSAFAEMAGRPTASPTELTELDIVFHLAVAEAAHSPLLVNLSKDLHSQLSESRRAAFAPTDRAPASAIEHAAIVDAIARGDGEGARAAVATHIGHVRGLLSSMADARGTAAGADTASSETSGSRHETAAGADARGTGA